jgi:hypothetical protein
MVPKLGLLVCGSRRHPCHPWTCTTSLGAGASSLPPATHPHLSFASRHILSARRQTTTQSMDSERPFGHTHRQKVSQPTAHAPQRWAPFWRCEPWLTAPTAHTCPNGTGGLLVTDLGRLQQPFLRLPRTVRQRLSFPLPLAHQPIRSTPPAAKQHALQWTCTSSVARRRPRLPPTHILCLYRPHRGRCGAR